MLIPTASLRSVARFRDEERLEVTREESILRSGPYRLYAGYGIVPFDDYSHEGDCLLLRIPEQQADGKTRLSVFRESGRYAVTDAYHVLTCEDDDDLAYLEIVLQHMASLPAPEAVRRQPADNECPESVGHPATDDLQIPWPKKSIREALVRHFDEEDLLIAHMAHRRADLLAGGVMDFDRIVHANGSPTRRRLDEFTVFQKGKTLAAANRDAAGRIPVVSTDGEICRTDVAGVAAPCIVLMPGNKEMRLCYCPEGAYPLLGTTAITMNDDAPISIEILAFALAYHGVTLDTSKTGQSGHPDSPDRRGHDCLTVQKIAHMEIELPTHADLDAFQTAVKDRIRASAQEGEKIDSLLADRRRLLDRIIDLDAGAFDDLDHVIDLDAGAFDDLDHTASDEPECASPWVRNLEALDRIVDELIATAPSFARNDCDDGTLWEMLPLLFSRFDTTDARWVQMVEDPEALRRIDDDLLTLSCRSGSLALLGQLTGSSSQLPPETRMSICRRLGELTFDDLPESGRGSFLQYFASRRLSRSTVDHRMTDGPCPEAIIELVGSLARTCLPGARTIFDPDARTGLLLDAVGESFPEAARFGQTSTVGEALICALGTYLNMSEPGTACNKNDAEKFEMLDRMAFRASGSRDDDQFSELRADVVITVTPPAGGSPTPGDSSASPSDRPVSLPRTPSTNAPEKGATLSTPQLDMSAVTEMQHAFLHRAEGGFAIVVMANSFLHEKRGVQPYIREKLVQSGCVRAVLSLPGGLFVDERAPVSIVVLGDPRDGTTCETLFIDGLGCGRPNSDMRDGIGVPSATLSLRILPSKARMLMEDTFARWMAAGCSVRLQDGASGDLGLPDFSRSIPKDRILEKGDLSPWSYCIHDCTHPS